MQTPTALRFAGAVALATFVALANAACASGPARPVYSELQLEVMQPAAYSISPETKVIAIVGFATESADARINRETIAQQIEDTIAGSIQKQGHLKVVERKKLDEALKELERGFSDAFDQQQAAEFGKFVQADAVLIGTVAIDVTVNRGPFERESPESIAAREAWAGRKAEWDNREQQKVAAWQQRKTDWDAAEHQKVSAWEQRKAEWEFGENQKRNQRDQEISSWQQTYESMWANADQQKQWAEKNPKPAPYQPEAFPEPKPQTKPFAEPAPIAEPFAEPQPAVKMVTWQFLEQQVEMTVTAKLVSVENGTVIGSSTYNSKGDLARDENANADGLRSPNPQTIAAGFLAEIAEKIMRDVTPHTQSTSRKVAAFAGGVWQPDFSKAANFMSQKAFELAEPVMNDVVKRAAIEPEKEENRYAQAAAYNNLGIIREATGKFEQAMMNYKKAVDLDSGNPTYLAHYQGVKAAIEAHEAARKQTGSGDADSDSTQ